jgi:hypothetical protein
MRLTSVALPALLGALLIPPRNPVRTASNEGFTVVVTSTSNGWAVECEKGCDWKGKASFTCATVCPSALVDSRGIVTLGEIRPPDRLFQFIVRREADGITAESRSGTYWKSLGWSCADQPCSARVSESGVTPLR